MDIIETIKNELNNCLKKLNILENVNFVIEIPKDTSNGDYATNIAMQLARILKKNPRQIAQDIVDLFDQKVVNVSKIEIAGPGFINFFIDGQAMSNVIEKVLKENDNFGCCNYGQNKKYDVEFVSANPTGDLHLGHARQAALGDSICNLLQAVGYQVTREYYVNDAGNQINNLAKSIYARYLQALGQEVSFPEDGYHGQDIIDYANILKKTYQDQLINKPLKYFKTIGIKYELDKIVKDLERFRLKFDVFTHELMLYEKGWVDEVIPFLTSKNYTYTADGAIWFKTTEFGDDKDRVLKKSDGSYTYLVPDIAYHKYKLERGFDYLLNILGADHHGYIKRLEAAVVAMGYNKDQIEVIIHQMVRLIKDNQEVKMSKRTGKAYTLKDLCDEIGVDAARYLLVSKNPSTHMDIDLDIAVKQSNDNPIYYIQYAHARAKSIVNSYEGNLDTTGSLLNSSKEIELLKHINEYEKVILDAAINKAPYRLTNYLYTLASLFHSFYNECKVVDKNNPLLTAQRVALVKITSIVIKNGLKLIGVEAYDKM